MSVASPRSCGIVIIVAPFCEMVGKFKTWSVCRRIFEVNDDQLLVSVLGEEKR